MLLLFFGNQLLAKSNYDWRAFRGRTKKPVRFGRL